MSLERQKIVHSPETQQRRYEIYREKLGLTDDVLKKVQSICDVGSGANDFAASLRQEYPDIFVLGIEPKEDSYELLDDHSIDHEARNIGIPDEAPKFDLVVSLDAVPKYFEVRGAGVASDRFDHSMSEQAPKDLEERLEAMVGAFSEMLRLTKKGGKVVVYPMRTKKDRLFTGQELLASPGSVILSDVALAKLKLENPNLQFKFFVDKEASAEQSALDKTPVVMSRLEITNRRS
jgi:hypothetical protein